MWESMLGSCTIVIIAHRLSTIQKVQTVMVMSGGQIVEQGGHAELLQNDGGHYATMLQSIAGGVPQVGNTASMAPTETGEEADGTDQCGQEIAYPKDSHTPTSVAAEDQEESPAHLDIELGVKPAVGPTHETGVLRRLWSISKAEMPAVGLGITASALCGIVLPLFGFLLASVVSVLYLPNHLEMRQRVSFWCWIFIAVGMRPVNYDVGSDNIPTSLPQCRGGCLSDASRLRILPGVLGPDANQESSGSAVQCNHASRDCLVSII